MSRALLRAVSSQQSVRCLLYCYMKYRPLVLSGFLSLFFLAPLVTMAAACTSITSASDYYSFDLNNSNDSVGSNNGTDVSMLYSAAAGKINNGANFASSPSTVITPGPGYNFPFSVSLWVNLQAVKATETQIFFTLPTGFGLSYGVGGKFLIIDNVTFVQPAATPSQNTWYHLVGVFDTTGSILYVNAVNSASTSGTNSGAGQTGFELGNIGALTRQYVGFMDEVGFYQCALTSAQVTSLYNGGAGINPFASAVRAFQFWANSLF